MRYENDAERGRSKSRLQVERFRNSRLLSADTGDRDASLRRPMDPTSATNRASMANFKANERSSDRTD